MNRYLLLILAGLLVWFIWDQFIPRTGSWRQKMTLHIDTPDGPISASNVVGVKFSGETKAFRLLFNSTTKMRGEAIYVDLNGKPLFVLLGRVEDLIYWTLFRTYDDTDGYSQSIRRIKRQTTPLVVPRKLWPMMVTFDDVTDPTSVRRVDPDDLAATFGEGIALREVTVQATDDPVTEGRVEEVLGWLRGHNSWLHITFPDGKNRDISTTEFVSEIFK